MPSQHGDVGLEPSEEGRQRWSQDGVQHLERRWILWHEFMQEHAHLDAWLRLAEQAVASHGSAHVTYAAAKEALRKFERFDVGSRLVQLDGLTQRNRTLTQLFHGVMRARLLGAARESGRRMDDVSAKLEPIVRSLRAFVSEWEEFEAEGEELSVWLAVQDVRLTEVERLKGSSCEKLRRLQALQECVCVKASGLSALLQRGEALIQRSRASDARHVESRLLELLRRCSHVYSSVARTHTRLLTARLVEDDCILPQASDSGCPSESALEEPCLDPTGFRSDSASPTPDQQGLEWDPSVDIGCSASCDDADSSYFSSGVCHRDDLKRHSDGGFESDVTSDDLNPDGRPPHTCPGVFSPAESGRDRDPPPSRAVTSPPHTEASELSPYDGGRVRAWLGVQSPSSCSKAVQTEAAAPSPSEASTSLVFERSSGAASFLLYLCGAAALALLAYLVWVGLEPPCHRGNRMHRSLQLALTYINGPPPT